MEKLNLVGYFNNVETIRELKSYTHSVGRMLTIVILGSLCGLDKVEKIHQWAESERVKEFLKEHFAILTIPSCSWLKNILSIINPDSLNRLFIEWTITLLPEFLEDLTVAFDGKSICSTAKMMEYDKPLHILTAYLCELGLSIGQQTVDEKSNEIPAMRELLKIIDVRGCMVVADALHCQTETAEAIVDAGADYLLNAKGNQEALEQDIKDYVEDDELRANMETASTCEKNGGRIEYREAFVTNDVEWMEEHLKRWLGLSCFGAINRRFTYQGKTSDEWHFYISSRNLTPEELLKYARNEWAIESMHWLLDVHFNEDSSRVRNENLNQNLNIVRKIALNYIRNYKNQTGIKLPVSKLLFSCLLDNKKIIEIIDCK